MAALVNGCVETARLKAESKGLQITVELPEDIPCIRGDAVQLGEVLQNLLDNAVQYTPSGGQIDVTACSNGHEVTFTVADTGIGIPESDLERIFERFYRVDAARSREAGGTGLGLVDRAAYRGCARRPHLGGERCRAGFAVSFQH